MRIILASKSPRRIEILNQLGIQADVVHPESKELLAFGGSITDPEVLTMENARNKALDVASRIKNEACVIGVDTIVFFGGHVLGKPGSSKQAAQYLKMLSGQWHEVVSSVYLVTTGNGNHAGATEKTKVLFRKLSDELIESYINTGEPLDKAGGYGIQGKGASLVEQIQGCYFNVVGLPVSKLMDCMNLLGLNVTANW